MIRSARVRENKATNATQAYPTEKTKKKVKKKRKIVLICCIFWWHIVMPIVKTTTGRSNIVGIVALIKKKKWTLYNQSYQLPGEKAGKAFPTFIE